MIPMDNVQEGLTNIINIAQSLDPTTIIYLLGSHAQDSATERSDIDLLIIAPIPPTPTRQLEPDSAPVVKQIEKRQSKWPGKEDCT